MDAEHDLGEDRAAADQRAEVQAEQADEDDHRVAEHVPDQHPLLGQALGPRGPDEVLGLDLQHAGAQYPRIEADVEDRQRDPREDQALEPQHGVLGELVIAQRRHPAEDRFMQAALGYQVGDLAEPEHRAGYADQGQDHEDRVVQAAAQPGGGDAHVMAITIQMTVAPKTKDSVAGAAAKISGTTDCPDPSRTPGPW